MNPPPAAQDNRTARLAGSLYLAMAVFSGFGLLYVPSLLVVPGDATVTATNIIASEGLFRSAILAGLVGQVIFVFLILVLYKLLAGVHRGLAVAMAVLALLGVPIAFLNEANLLSVLVLLNGPEYLAVFDTTQLHAQAMLLLDNRDHGILLAQIFWGLWLFPLGSLVTRSRFLPRLLGILLIVGGLGYVIDASAAILLPAAGIAISQFTFVGELLFPLWLLAKGVDPERGEKNALA